MKKKKLYILSPSDRFNYGDMLFPYILNHYLGTAVDEIVNCASTKSDLSDRGGLPTVGYYSIYEADKTDDNYLIVAGGESLFVPWSVILSFIYKDVEEKVNTLYALPKIPMLHRIYHTYLNHYIKKTYQVRNQYPFTPSLHEFPCFKSIMFNSVGAACLLDRKDIIRNKSCKRILDSASYMAVRDRGTGKALDKMEVKYHLYPDSAILMSEVFSDSYIEARQTINESMPKGKYIFFQVNLASAKGKEAFWGNLITTVFRKTNIKFLLCPIGTALGHSDDIALKSISQYISHECYYMIENPTIWDIMYLIKNSCLYVGTSLHGAITATSFSIPMVTHGKTKVRQYLTDWGGYFTVLNNLEEDIIKQLTHPIIPSPIAQKKLALQSMRNMRAIIEKS